MYGFPALDAGNDHVGQWEMVSDVVGDVGGSVCATSVGAVNDVCGSVDVGDSVGDSVCVGEQGLEVEHIPTDKDAAGRSYKEEAVSVNSSEWEAEAYRDAKSAAKSALAVASASKVTVKGRLRRCLPFWIKAPQAIMDLIKNGYVLPLKSEPTNYSGMNFPSAISHAEYVQESILDLLATGCVVQVMVPPHVCSPLSVVVSS